MPQRAKLLVASFAEVIVTNVQAIDGNAYIDCWDPITMRSWKSMPMLQQGGRAGKSSVFPPYPAKGGAVTENEDVDEASRGILLLRQDRGICFLGCLPPVGGTLQDEDEGATELTDRLQRAKTDASIEHGGSKVSVAADGSVTMNTRGAALSSIRQQLSDSGILRISRAGEADDRFILASKLISYLTTSFPPPTPGSENLADYLNRMAGIVNNLVLWANAADQVLYHLWSSIALYASVEAKEPDPVAPTVGLLTKQIFGYIFGGVAALSKSEIDAGIEDMLEPKENIVALNGALDGLGHPPGLYNAKSAAVHVSEDSE